MANNNSDITKQNEMFNNSLTIFDRIGSNINKVFSIISNNEDKLNGTFTSSEAEEILKRFKSK